MIIFHIYKNTVYLLSHWVVLNNLYTVSGVSDGFRFEPYKHHNDTEMCMSLVLQEDANTIICPVSFNKEYVNIYEFNLDAIFNGLTDNS